MRSFAKWTLGVMGFLFLTISAIWLLAPSDNMDTQITFDANALPDDLDAYLSQREDVFSDITPGAGKRIVWAAAAGQRTPLAIVYLHGFSATSEEIRPIPDDVAAALGANLYFTRLAGHGRGGEALASATSEDWITDLDEALAIGRRLGDRVILIGTSTGGTLAALAATDSTRSEGLAGVALISPNFALASAAGAILDMPFARVWGPWVAGAERSFVPQNADHARWWTTRYPTAALFPMATLTRTVRAFDFAQAKVPALFVYVDADQVVNAATTARIAAAWGAPVTTIHPTLTPQDDPYAHVIAGHVLSPNQSQPVTAAILDWAQTL